MKLSQMCVVVLLVVLGSAMVFADSMDPKIIIKGGGSEVKGKCEKCMGVGMNFSFSVPAGGSGDLFFTNESGKNWTSLKLIETGIPAADISCHSNLFMSCKTETLKNGEVEILLSGVKGKAEWADHGIVNGQSFEMQFSCKGGCWVGPNGSPISFNAHASTGTVPEPGTLALLATGLVALVSRRKMWRRGWQA
jgi:PEP-CTERM motif